mgnify:CR=1 FL=1
MTRIVVGLLLLSLGWPAVGASRLDTIETARAELTRGASGSRQRQLENLVIETFEVELEHRLDVALRERDLDLLLKLHNGRVFASIEYQRNKAADWDRRLL